MAGNAGRISLDVLKLVLEELQLGDNGLHELFCILTVCKSWKNVALPILYSDIAFETSTDVSLFLAGLQRQLSRGIEVGSWVRYMSCNSQVLEQEHTNDDPVSDLTAAFAYMDQLVSLVLPWNHTSAMLAVISRTASNLQELEVILENNIAASLVYIGQLQSLTSLTITFGLKAFLPLEGALPWSLPSLKCLFLDKLQGTGTRYKKVNASLIPFLLQCTLPKLDEFQYDIPTALEITPSLVASIKRYHSLTFVGLHLDQVQFPLVLPHMWMSALWISPLSEVLIEHLPASTRGIILSYDGSLDDQEVLWKTLQKLVDVSTHVNCVELRPRDFHFTWTSSTATVRDASAEQALHFHGAYQFVIPLAAKGIKLKDGDNRSLGKTASEVFRLCI